MAIPSKIKNNEDLVFLDFKKKLQKYLNSYQIVTQRLIKVYLNFGPVNQPTTLSLAPSSTGSTPCMM